MKPFLNCFKHFIFILTICTFGALPVLSMSFDQLFKDFDFEQFAKDLEEGIAEMEDKGINPFGLPQKPQPQAPTKEPTKVITPEESENIEKLFLEPLKIPEQKKGHKEKVTIKISDKKIAAYDDYLERLVRLINEIEKKTEIKDSLSQAFKNVFSHFQEAIDVITVQKDIIRDKKMYLRIFYADTKQANEMRKKIVDAVKKLESLNQGLRLTEKEESGDVLTRDLKSIAEKELTLPDTDDDHIEREKRSWRRGDS